MDNAIVLVLVDTTKILKILLVCYAQTTKTVEPVLKHPMEFVNIHVEPIKHSIKLKCLLVNNSVSQDSMEIPKTILV